MIASISSFLCALKSLQVMVDTSTVCANADEAAVRAAATSAVLSNRMGRLPGLLIEHDLFRPAFARRSVQPNEEPCHGLRAGGKPVPTPHQVRGRLFRDHALSRNATAGRAKRSTRNSKMSGRA